MSHSSSRRDFVIKLATLSAVGASSLTLSACGGGGDDAPPAFSYGVASGDPLADRVILWTHARYPDRSEAVALTWEIATDNAFTQIVRQGLAQASAGTDFTVKVDATGLSANREYFYRFRQGRHLSPIGRTRTLPTGNVSEVKLAVFSCANYPAGFFNVYAEAARSDAQFAVHLGDYIYEYGATNADGSPAYASADAAALGRVSQPTQELTLLSHYRQRHAQYKSDPDSKDLHARMPMIAVWDDHEIANDSYKDGADNHDPVTEGSFATRKQAALQAYHEWMPIRTGTDPSIIYRSFNFGQLLSLHRLPERLRRRPLHRHLPALGGRRDGTEILGDCTPGTFGTCRGAHITRLHLAVAPPDEVGQPDCEPSGQGVRCRACRECCGGRAGHRHHSQALPVRRPVRRLSPA